MVLFINAYVVINNLKNYLDNIKILRINKFLKKVGLSCNSCYYASHVNICKVGYEFYVLLIVGVLEMNLNFSINHDS